MSIALTEAHRDQATAERMANAARRFLEALAPAQRNAATIAFAGDLRYIWDYRPQESKPRNGLRLVNMTEAQQRAALDLMATGLSERGLRQTRRIMEREVVLREAERIEQLVNQLTRDPELYSFAVVGQPGDPHAWGWTVGGHHVGLHFTVVGGDMIAPTPLFFGANPAEVRYGPQKGDRLLPEEEDMARGLLGMLDPDLKSVAIYSPEAPRDILTDAYRRAHPGVLPRGLALARMGSQPREQLVGLIRHYVERSHESIAGPEWRRLEAAGLETVTFAWAGPEEPGRGHYYAITGPTFMIEYDNTQNGANHIHSVWRSFAGDWGEDLLAAHYADAHRAGQLGHAHGNGHSH